MTNNPTFYNAKDMQYYKEFRYILSKLEVYRHDRFFEIQKNGIQYFEFSSDFENVKIEYLEDVAKGVDNLVLENKVTESDFNIILNYLTLVFKIHQITLANFHTKLDNIEKIDSNFKILFNHNGLDDSNFIDDSIVTEIDRLFYSVLKSINNTSSEFSETYSELTVILTFWKYEYDLAKTLEEYADVLERETR